MLLLLMRLAAWKQQGSCNSCIRAVGLILPAPRTLTPRIDSWAFRATQPALVISSMGMPGEHRCGTCRGGGRGQLWRMAGGGIIVAEGGAGSRGRQRGAWVGYVCFKQGALRRR